jgi:hypothetical protein
MGLSQALSAAVAGVNATQQSLSVIAGNVANANTPGYVDESVNQIATSTAGQPGVSVDTTAINRNLNTLLRTPAQRRHHRTRDRIFAGDASMDRTERLLPRRRRPRGVRPVEHSRFPTRTRRRPRARQSPSARSGESKR